MGEWSNKYYVDFRFFVENAEDMGNAADKADALIKEATDEVWYSISKVTKLQKNPNKKIIPWEICSVRMKDPRSNQKAI